jgi:hypothetical protein
MRLTRPTGCQSFPHQLVKHLRRRSSGWHRIAPAIGLSFFFLTSCAMQKTADLDQSKEAKVYLEHTKTYAPPGPPEDPWGPYIAEATTRFDVPERWVREVMRVESGGRMVGADGLPITSPVGAMGLMQVMPETYDGLRARYALDGDPYDPHNNILAGTAYIREMYDVYGAPGFLAAYNAGPGRLEDYLYHHRPLPDETRRYVAMIGPYIRDSWPERRSPAEDDSRSLAYDMPTTPRPYARSRYAAATPARTIVGRGGRGPVEVASLPEPSRHDPRHPGAVHAQPGHESQPRFAAIVPGPGVHPNFRLIPTAMAEGIASRRGGPAAGNWAIQVGAFGNENLARAAVGSARGHASMPTASPTVASVHQGRATLYRARLTGMSRDAAVHACERLSHGKGGCTVLSPNAQS